MADAVKFNSSQNLRGLSALGGLHPRRREAFL
jgi:hypothetical protein